MAYTVTFGAYTFPITPIVKQSFGERKEGSDTPTIVIKLSGEIHGTSSADLKTRSDALIAACGFGESGDWYFKDGSTILTEVLTSACTNGPRVTSFDWTSEMPGPEWVVLRTFEITITANAKESSSSSGSETITHTLTTGRGRDRIPTLTSAFTQEGTSRWTGAASRLAADKPDGGVVISESYADETIGKKLQVNVVWTNPADEETVIEKSETVTYTRVSAQCHVNQILSSGSPTFDVQTASYKPGSLTVSGKIVRTDGAPDVPDAILDSSEYLYRNPPTEKRSTSPMAWDGYLDIWTLEYTESYVLGDYITPPSPRRGSLA